MEQIHLNRNNCEDEIKNLVRFRVTWKQQLITNLKKKNEANKELSLS